MTHHDRPLQSVSQHPVPRPPPILQPTPPAPPYEEAMELSSYAAMLAASRWLILSATLVCLLLGLAYALVARPVYEATMLIHVEEDKPNNSKNMIGEISALFDVKAAAISEMELIKSRMVVAQAVDHLGLYVDAGPEYLPLIGRAIARFNPGLSEPGLFGYGGYAWGNEKIDIADFYVPPALQSTSFMVTALGGGQYRLRQPQHRIDVTGRVGATLTLAVPNGRLTLRVNQLHARAGAAFHLRYLPKLDAIEHVQKAMTVVEIGKQSGLISVTMEASDPKAAYDILSAIGREYLRQNVARKLEEAEKSLAFLDRQLPDIKRRLDQSEHEYYDFRNGNGTIDLTEEAKLSLQQSSAAKARRIELQQKRQELLGSFTEQHPVVRAVDTQIAHISAEIARTEAHIRQLPMLERDLLHLSREVKINSDLYSTLQNSAQQLRLVKAGKVSNVRMIDPPMMPQQPARPDRGKIVAISLVAGLVLGLALAVVRSMLNKGIDNPASIERMLGARVVYATIPHSQGQETLDKGVLQGAGTPGLLACVEPEDPAIEVLRCFRTSLHSAMAHCHNNIIQISGPTERLGQSFVVSNLAAVLAMSGKRVVLIDADLRGGQLHRVFECPAENGLTSAIAGTIALELAIHPDIIPGLHFIATGPLPPNPSEFLLHPRFAALLQTLSQQYDYVLIDSAPLLSVSDALVTAGHAGAMFLLTRAGATTEEEINESIKRLNQAGIAPQGVLFNGHKPFGRQVQDHRSTRPSLLAHAR
ncbi:polysaccharide biosynthesis tyrosine autokinase [Pseudoduganella namucuonensis]|uniref:Tyrosine-protein kinase Etk/Wzc n=1 Tax=Pseudoduganella namucuonensis TaxID=1035707 RepID=A0A1I7K2V7_9BURK|nr:polysaccharide biosynthesis tyrosine autokinase [Pseudoduganella namucuonensis]SFU91722.1 tyrosine-protein kinase Etk/Wzc [Pseudoduganella namucuonensis]